MRYYVVGLPIADLKGNLFFGVSGRNIPLEEIKNSLYNQKSIKVFCSYDEAKNYSHALREKSYDYCHYPKNPLSKSKVRPIFTVELASSVDLGELQKDSFTYEETYLDEQRYRQTRETTLELKYYEIASYLIETKNVKRCEFIQSPLKTLEIENFEAKQSCTIS